MLESEAQTMCEAMRYTLEGVGVLNRDGKDKLVLLLYKTAVQLRQVNQT